MKTIDGTNAVLGRLSSAVAKELLKGNAIHIVNAEKVIITGDSQHIINNYLERRRRGSPQHGPFFPSTPDAIVRRCVRGMLPYKTSKGRAAFKNLKVSVGGTGGEGMQKPVRTSYVTVGKVAEALGWRK
jgi:large subunit ribosomal protein L13